jgi:hypothetical protein
MGRKRTFLTVISVWYAFVLVLVPLLAGADEAAPVQITATAAPSSGPVLITEVQTGTTASAAEEFIELYNSGAETVNFDTGGWQLQVGNATAANWDAPYRTIPLTGTLAPGAYYIIASKTTVNAIETKYMAGSAAVWFSAGLSAEGAHMRLVYNVNQNTNGVCGPALAASDEMEWSVPDATNLPVHPSIDARKPFLTAAAGLPVGSGLQRFRTATGGYVDTDNDQTDFALAVPSPAALSSVVSEIAAATPAAIIKDDCQAAPTPATVKPATPASQEALPTEVPQSNTGLLAPQISEMLPNPAAPQTDENDEYIELYNANAADFDLSGFVMESGLTANHKFTFPAGTVMPAQSFKHFSIKDTKLVLANGGGQVTLKDVAGNMAATSDAYGKAPAGQAWILAEGSWQWTTVPTPGGVNAVSPPPVEVPKETVVKEPSAVASPVKKATTTVKTVAPKKAAAVKAASTAKIPKAKTVASEPKPVQTMAVTKTEPKSSPLHPSVLAVAAVLALLYGAYEYRHDMANLIRKLRGNRASGGTPSP